MKRGKKLQLIAALVFLVSAIFIQPVSALVVISQDYPGSGFGTGMATLNPSSNFDISIGIKNIGFTENTTLAFTVDFAERIGAEKTDAYIDYSIIDEEQSQIFNQIEKKSIEDNLSYEKEIQGVKFGDGDYLLVVSAIYGDMERAFATQRFKIENGQIKLLYGGSLRYYIYKYGTWIALAFFALFLIIAIPLFVKYLDRKYHRKLLRFKHLTKKKVTIPIFVHMVDFMYKKKKT
jgi:hypothetical protein